MRSLPISSISRCATRYLLIQRKFIKDGNEVCKHLSYATPHSYLGKFLLGLISMCFCAGVTFGQVATPQLVPMGDISRPVSYTVLVTCATAGAEMRYTLDGSEPFYYSPFYYSDPVPASGYVIIPRTATLKVKAWLGAEFSPVATGNFQVVGDIAAGGTHSLAIKTNRTAAAWGNPLNGRLANGTSTTAQPLPAPANRSSSLSFSTATSVAAGLHHSLFLYSDDAVEGGIYSCGLNSAYQLGSGATTVVPGDLYPRPVITASGAPLTGAIQVAAADTYSAALMADGKVMTWGANTSGRLGRSSATSLQVAGIVTTSATATTHLTDIDQISAGKTHMLARQGGQVYAWGLNSSGQLGINSTSSKSYATLNHLLANITDIAAGEAHSAVVRWDATNQGTVYCFGAQQYGRLGNKLLTSANVNAPTQVHKSATGNDPLTGIIEVACGPSHTLARDSSNRVWAWGSNFDGELGDNSALNAHRAYASLVKDPSGTGVLQNITRIVAGGVSGNGFSLAIAKDGKVYAWGANDNGQLGCGDTLLKRLPCEIPNLVLTNIQPPVLRQLRHNILVQATPGQATISADFSDFDGIYDISHVIFKIGNRSIRVYNNAANVTANTYPKPPPYTNSSTVTFDATFSDLESGQHSYFVEAYDKSGFSYNGPYGNFSIKQSVSVTTLASQVIEGQNQSTFRLNRVTDGFSFQSPLTVVLSTSGSATPGVDYALSSTVATIPARSSYVDISLNLLNDNTLERSETIVVAVLPSSQYGITNGTASTLLVDKDDVDDDGWLDTVELAWFGNLSQTVDGDYDGDGLSNKDELEAGTSPATDQTAIAAQREYLYDENGRLTKGESTEYGYDAEGNMETAQ